MAKKKRNLGKFILELRMIQSDNAMMVDKIHIPEMINVKEIMENVGEVSVEETYRGLTIHAAVEQAVTTDTLASWEWLKRWHNRTLPEDAVTPTPPSEMAYQTEG